MIHGPCKDCPKRNPGCHSRCLDYQLFVQKKDNYKKNIMNIVEFIQSEEGKELINSIKNNNAQTK